MSQNTFSMAGGVARNPLVRLAKPITSTIGANEHIAIVGPNGGGKSLFVDTLIGKYPLREGTIEYDFSPSATQTVYDNVKYIAVRKPSCCATKFSLLMAHNRDGTNTTFL